MSEGGQTDGQEKSHEPTPRKLQKAREKGDVPQSREVNIAASYIGFFIGLLMAGAWSAHKFGELFTPFLDRPVEIFQGVGVAGASAAVNEVLWRSLIAVSPLILAPAIGVILSLIAQRAVAFAPSKLQPKLNRLSIIDNAKQKYGPSGLMEFAKSTAKLLFISTVVWLYIVSRADELLTLMRVDARHLGAMLFQESVWLVGLAGATSIVIAGIDLPFQRHHHAQKQKMTTEELKKEQKESEGDPHMKAARQQKGRDIATNQMLADVPKANVVIVNPTHYAVALEWSRESGKPPVLLAKGVDEIAARIRAVAAENGIPIRRDPPTARSIHALVEIGDPIEREHYAAVAAAVRYAEEVRRAARERNA
ncbi:MAG: flagellar type III secretion system protein FlhB [Pseudomonadota bacterium]